MFSMLQGSPSKTKNNMETISLPISNTSKKSKIKKEKKEKKEKDNPIVTLFDEASSVTSPSSSPIKKPKEIILTGILVYFCSVSTEYSVNYTKIILENKMGDSSPYKIVRIIGRKGIEYFFPSWEYCKKENVMIKIDKEFYEHSLANESLNTFGETYMSPLTRTLKTKTKTCHSVTLDTMSYDPSRPLFKLISRPRIKKTQILPGTQDKKKRAQIL